jgi:hypothetical protein
MNKYLIDVIEVLTAGDGNFNEGISAFVTAYPISEDTLAVELEYVDSENDNEVIEVKSFEIKIEES